MKAPEPRSNEYQDEEVDSLEQACDKLDQRRFKEVNETQSYETMTETQNSSNILNEPVSPKDYKLQHRKSIHDYFNPELVNSNSKQTNSSTED